MITAALKYVAEEAESGDEEDLKSLRDALNKKLEDFESRKPLKAWLKSMQRRVEWSDPLSEFKGELSEEEKQTIRSIFKSIKIQEVYVETQKRWNEDPVAELKGMHFTIGFKAEEILPSLHFEGEIGTEIAEFADSCLNIKSKGGLTEYWDASRHIKIWNGVGEILNVFPILSIPLDMQLLLRPLIGCLESKFAVPYVFKEGNLGGDSWKWGGWSQRQREYAMERCFRFCNDEKWRFLKEIMELPFKSKFHIYTSVAKPVAGEDSIDWFDSMQGSESEFSDELSDEWQELNAALNEIERSVWLEMWNARYQKHYIRDKRFKRYWIKKLDPENKFFQQTRKRKRVD